ncbi:hypothetical protein BKA91DRAFT_135244 [Yarrowia lipolytica]|nr:hypothetical protein BKA91DRAFT_135244 [Yarrowia lipolytica]KAE8172654.1 hypothetical protein BKA90DRAFT_137026 [Yarrowia lipolytica]RMI99576.1 hypothetical protein BD777DRAFT_124282 [Yarrowia lipolytica]
MVVVFAIMSVSVSVSVTVSVSVFVADLRFAASFSARARCIHANQEASPPPYYQMSNPTTGYPAGLALGACIQDGVS